MSEMGTNGGCCSRSAKKCAGLMTRNLLMTMTIVGVVIGFVVGFSINTVHPSEETIMWLRFPGELFLSLLGMTIIPVIVTSVISATATMNPKENGKISAIQISYLLGTNFLCALIGCVFGVSLRPGSNVFVTHEVKETTISKQTLKSQDIFADMIRNLIPENVVKATLQKVQTQYVYTEERVDNFSSNVTLTAHRNLSFADSINVLGLIFICIVFGIAASRAKEKGRAFLLFFQSANEIVLIILSWFLWAAPVGVCSLIMASIGGIEDLSSVFVRLGMLVLTVSLGLVVHQLLILPFIFFVLVRRNPYPVLLRMGRAWVVAFASAASVCAMPYMYPICEGMKINKKVYSFGIPFAVTLNADGSIIFICVSSIFLAQYADITLTVGHVFLIGMLTGFSAMALPSVPSSSLVTVVIICTTLQLPASNVGLLFAVEWFLDRVRTTSNVVGEIYSIVITNHFCEKDLIDNEVELENTFDQGESQTRKIDEVENNESRKNDRPRQYSYV